MTAPPLISVIIATYNSSHLLKYAIQSVIDSSYKNWELIVVGDHCTDDTEQTVASFNDHRIHFLNLDTNSGQQAKPNNVGMSLAKGEYISFLNQDDFYFNSHLEDCIKHIENSKAEMICVPSIQAKQINSDELKKGNLDMNIIGVHPNGKYSPFIFNVASSWFFKQDIINKVGLWKLEHEIYVTPSQDFLFRAWKAGVKINFPEKPGILVIFSSARKNFYQQNTSYEHEHFHRLIRDPEKFPKLIETAINHTNQNNQNHFRQYAIKLFKLAAYPIYKILEGLNIHPYSLHVMLKWGGKGKLIAHLRKKAGAG